MHPRSQQDADVVYPPHPKSNVCPGKLVREIDRERNNGAHCKREHRSSVKSEEAIVMQAVTLSRKVHHGLHCHDAEEAKLD